MSDLISRAEQALLLPADLTADAVAGVLGVRERWRRCLPSREHVGPENARGEVADETARSSFGGLVVSRLISLRARASQGA